MKSCLVSDLNVNDNLGFSSSPYKGSPQREETRQNKKANRNMKLQIRSTSCLLILGLQTACRKPQRLGLHTLLCIFKVHLHISCNIFPSITTTKKGSALLRYCGVSRHTTGPAGFGRSSSITQVGLTWPKICYSLWWWLVCKNCLGQMSTWSRRNVGWLVLCQVHSL